MKKLVLLAIFVFVAAAGWSLGQKLSPDALSMAIGVLFGVLAGIPAALLALAAARRSDRGGDTTPRQRQDPQPPTYPAPVIVVSPPTAGYGAPQSTGYQPNHYLTAGSNVVNAPSRREFRVVGADDEWVDEA